MTKLLLKHKEYILLILLAVLTTFLPPADPDFGWHYKYGEYIVNTGKILRENIFSYTFQNYSWANSYTLAQITFYSLHELLGPIGMVLILTLFLNTATIIILKNTDLKKWQVFIASLILFIFYKAFLVPVRPLLFSTILMLILFQILLYHPKNIKYLPLIFLIWANTHADYTLGLFVLGVYNIQDLITKGLNKTKIPQYIFSISCILVTLINPYGIGLWETLFKEVDSIQFMYILEWQPLKKELLLTYILVAALIIVSLIELENKKEKAWMLIEVLFFFILSIRFSYMIRVFIIAGIFPLLEFLNNPISELQNFFSKKEKAKINKALKLVFIGFYIVGFPVFIVNLQKTRDPKYWAPERKYPYEAVKFINDNKELFQGKMFNSYNWGGYLIWQLSEHKTFIDGRMPSWKKDDKSLLREYMNFNKNPKENHSLIEDYEIDWFLIKKDSKTGKYLREEKEEKWILIHESENAWIFIKKDTIKAPKQGVS